MCSSYDRASQLDPDTGEYLNWDANGDAGQFIRDEPGGWHVMADLKGVGALTRVWSANASGQLRIVLDGQPVVDTPFANLFTGKWECFRDPLCYWGRNCYVPIGFNQSCLVMVKDATPFYQINYVLFPPGTKVQRFALKWDEKAEEVFQIVVRAWNKDALLTGACPSRTPPHRANLRPIQQVDTVAPGGKVTHRLPGAGTLRTLRLDDLGSDPNLGQPKPWPRYAAHQIVLRIFFDDERTPSVEVPLPDFFGSGYAPAPVTSLPLRSAPGRRSVEQPCMSCFFPMPFRNGARIELENLRTEPLRLSFEAEYDDTPPAPDALRFHARFRREDPARELDYPILEATGRGRVVGCLLNVDMPRNDWWGEGDDKVWIDGEKFPSYFGTGSEDYLCDAWGLHVVDYPLHGATRASVPGKSSAYRWHIPDCINFQKSVRFTIENWQRRRQWDVDYSTIAYWYAAPDAPPVSEKLFPPLTREMLTPRGLKMPGVVEAEDVVNWPGVDAASVALIEEPPDGLEFSGGKAVKLAANAPTPVPLARKEPRTVNLIVHAVPGTPFGKLTVATRSRTIGTVDDNRNGDGTYALGMVAKPEWAQPLTVTCDTPVVLDWWQTSEVGRIGGAFEGEDLRQAPPAGAAELPMTTEWVTLPWSAGGQAVFDVPANGLVRFSLPHGSEGRPPRAAELFAYLTKDPNGGTFQVLFNDAPIGAPVALAAPKPERIEVPVGTVAPKPGESTLAFRRLGGPSGRLGLDAVVLRRLRDPNSVEAELCKVVNDHNCPHSIQPLAGEISAGGQVFCTPGAPGGWVDIEVPVAKPGRYAVSVVYTLSGDYGIVQPLIDGKKIGEPLDTFGRLQAGPIHPLGEFDLKEKFTLRTEVVGKNPSSAGYFFGVDCLILEPVVGR